MKSKKQILAMFLATCWVIGCGSWGASSLAGQPLAASNLVLSEQVTVNDVSVSAQEDATRLVLELSSTSMPQYAVFILNRPDRLVIDIAAAHLNDVGTLSAEQGLIKRVRSGMQPGGKLRIVADLTHPVVAQERVVATGDTNDARIVIDLQSAKTSRVIPASNGPVSNRLVSNGVVSNGVDSNGHASSNPVSSSTPASSTHVSSHHVANKRVSNHGADATSLQPPVPVKVAAETRVREVVVAVDPGHGGQDPGALGRSAQEKEVTLAIARRLAEQINRDPRMRAVLTRSTDEFVSLRERIQRARRASADIFVSIHADAYKDKSVQGSSVYVLSSKGASDEASLWLAKSENSADLIGGVSLEDKNDVLASVLFDLSQGASMSASMEAADNVLRELDRVGNVRRPAVQFAGFVVLKSPDIPSMLVETAFITNPGEESKLTDPDHQEALARAIHAGVRRYFETNPPLGTRFAEARRKSEDKALLAKREPDEERVVGPRGRR